MYDPSILLINENEIHIYSKSFNELNSMKDFNARLLSLIQEDRKRALSSGLALNGTPSSEPDGDEEVLDEKFKRVEKRIKEMLGESISLIIARNII